MKLRRTERRTKRMAMNRKQRRVFQKGQKRVYGRLPVREITQLRGAYDTSHHLIESKITPDSFIAFREELNSGRHQDIVEACIPLSTFEDCIAKICEMLDIVVDGLYDIGPMSAMLVEALKNRSKLKAGVIAAHELAPGLVRAEIVETPDEVKLEIGEDVKNAETLGEVASEVKPTLITEG